MNFMIQLENTNFYVYFFKICFISFFTYYVSLRITNVKEIINKKIVTTIIILLLINGIYTIIRNKINFIYATIFIIIALNIVFFYKTQENIIKSLIVTVLSFSICNVIFAFSIIISAIPTYILKIENSIIEIFVINTVFTIIMIFLLKIKRVKNGFAFLKKDYINENFDIAFFNLGLVGLILIIILQEFDKSKADIIGILILMLGGIIFTTIKKSFQLYYKQTQLIKTLEETQKELEEKTKEVEELEKENLEFSKTSHSLAHKQKSLEHKLNKILENNKIEETEKLRESLEEISEKLYIKPENTQLAKTEIPQIDDMLEYMQNECIKNKIEFELQVNGNIHHMTNNYVTKEELEILLADHIKDAIIAINYSENKNRSILVRLGKIDGEYGIYIYDSGIEFEQEVLEKLGKEPITTHKDSGGTGMGFMNTFDTLNKHKASLEIKKIGSPSSDEYTKIVKIKFDGKNEVKI